MLRFALSDEKKIIQDIWTKDGSSGFNNYYFSLAYPKGLHYLLINDEIESVASVYKHEMMLHGRKLKVSMIAGIKTKLGYQGIGNEKVLLDEVMSQLSRQDLITITHAKNKELYEAKGFKVAYLRNCYHFERYNFDGVEINGISHEFDTQDLAKAYKEFTSRFNGYILRGKAYFDELVVELEFRKMNIMAIYLDNEIKGYFSFKLDGDKLYINECIYKDIKTLAKIISYSLKLAKDVYLYVSEAERLERVFKQADYKTSEYMMLRINDYDLFNQLYNSNVSEVNEALTLINYPLFIREDL